MCDKSDDKINKNKDIEKISQLFYEMVEERKIFINEYYPTDIPNEVCNHAMLKGILFENSFNPKVHDFHPIMAIGDEQLYIWTHTKNKYSSLISKVGLDVKKKNLWKNIGNIIQLSYSYLRDFEHTMEVEYKWVYYFDPQNEITEQSIYDCSNFDRHSLLNGTQLKLTELKVQSRLIELLLRDEKAYTALSNMYASMKAHYCCLICELERNPFKKHPSHEPEIWEQASVISDYETAIVQACRSVEALIGKPPNRDNRSRLLQHKQKWEDALGISPDDIFKKGDMSYIEFYYKMFELRNSAAHSYGSIPFDLERKQAVDSQCFASLLLDGYINNNILSEEEAIKVLKLNMKLIEKVDEAMSTTSTVEEQ